MQQDKAAKEGMKQQRERLQEVVNRAKKDASFKQQLTDDPVTVLRQAGVSDEGMGDFLREEGFTDRDPTSPTLTPGQRRAVEFGAARGCWFTCVFTDKCNLTVG